MKRHGGVKPSPLKGDAVVLDTQCLHRLFQVISP